MISVRLSKNEWEWIIGTLEYVNDFSPPERATVESIKEQLTPDYKWDPPPRPPVADAVIESFVDVVERAIGNCNWVLNTYGLSGEAKDSLFRARRQLADILAGLGNTSRWFQSE